jgi:hypothetical protein
MKITLCEKGLKGDIPVYEYEDTDEGLNIINVWLNERDFNNHVYVCFASYGSFQSPNLHEDHNSFLVSRIWDDIIFMVESYLDIPDHKETNFFIFEFEGFTEAFKYCSDLTEPF